MSELRFHPFLDQWVITATHRQDRTFLPPDDYCPLCPTQPGGFPTEIPFSEYDIVVFENKFPSLSATPPEPAVPGSEICPVRPSAGVCEVICYSQVHDSTFATMPLSQARKLARVWRERYVSLGERSDVDYVFIFENKGKEIGVTLSHPHGQIYAYPFIPPVLKIELEAEKRHYRETGRPLMQDWLAMELGGDYAHEVRRHGAERETIDRHPHSSKEELPTAPRKMPWTGHEQANGERLIWENETFVALIPFFARYPYETYVTSKRHIRSLAEMSDRDLDDLAEILLQVTRRFDRLFGISMPYIMAMHQEPTTAGFDYNWFHIEFYPPYRTAKKLKYLAGSEAGAGAFINDTLPEATAKTMREIEF